MFRNLPAKMMALSQFYLASVNADSYANAVSNGASTDNCVVERNGTKAYDNDAPGPGEYLQVSSIADNASDLTAAFKAIAEELSKLRISG